MRPLRLEIRHIETVVAIVESGTMTEAAHQLSVTQSALSHRLAEAERRLGVTLFTRGADRRLTTTNHGVALHQSAVSALIELRRIEELLTDADPAVRATVRIGVGSYQTFHWYPGFLARLRTERPDLDLDLHPVGDAPGTPLAAREVDVVLAPGDPSGDLDRIGVLDDELVLVCAPDHPLAPLDVVRPDALADQTYLTYNARPSPGFEYDRFIRPAGDIPRIVRVVPETSAIVELVAAGVGVSILSRWATAPFVEAGRLVTARCGPGGLPIRWHAVHRRGDDLARDVAIALADHLTA